MKTGTGSIRLTTLRALEWVAFGVAAASVYLAPTITPLALIAAWAIVLNHDATKSRAFVCALATLLVLAAWLFGFIPTSTVAAGT